MEGPISFWGYKEQESNLILPEHDDDDDDDDDDKKGNDKWNALCLKIPAVCHSALTQESKVRSRVSQSDIWYVC